MDVYAKAKMKSATTWKESNPTEGTTDGKNPKWNPDENIILKTGGDQRINLQLWDKGTDNSDNLIG